MRLLKLEAEGAEPEVLQGALGLLSLVDYISADLGPERGKAEISTLEEVSNLLEEQGFERLRVEGERVIALFRNHRLRQNLNQAP